MSDFDILIGVDLSDAEAKIKNMLQRVGASYPVKLEATLNDKSIKMKLGDIQKLKSNIEKFNLKIDNKGTNGLKESLKSARKEAQLLEDNIDKGLRKLKESIKTTMTADGKKTSRTSTYGNEDGSFKATISNNGQTIKEETNLEKIRTNELKLQNQIAKQREAIEEKVAQIKQKGIAHGSKIKSIEKDIAQLDNAKSMSLAEQLKLVDKLSSKYKDLKKDEQSRAFTKDRKTSADNVQSKVNKNIDTDKINEAGMKAELDRVNKLIQEIYKKESKATISTAVNNAVKAYDKLLSKQQEYINNQKKQESMNITKTDNSNKINNLDSKGFIPQSMIDNVKALNSSLDFSSSKGDIAEVNREIQRLVKLQEDVKNAYKDEGKRVKLIEQAQQELVKATDKYASKLDDIQHSTQRNLTDESRLADVNQEIARIVSQINSYKERGKDITYQEHQSLQNSIKALTRQAQAHKDSESTLTREAKLVQQINDRFESISYRAQRGLNMNPNGLRQVRREVETIEDRLRNLSSLTGNAFNSELNGIQRQMNDLNRNARTLRDSTQESQNSMLNRFQRAMTSVPIYMSAMSIFYGAVSQIQKGFEGILEIDKAMTNLSKVTEATNTQLEHFKETAHEIGAELGVLSADVISATAEFQKLGFSLQESTQLGKNSILYANVGDMSVDDATSNIIASVKGFGIEIDKEGKNVQKLVDIFNEVGNNFSISSAGIGDALTRSASVLHEAGNTTEQAVALVASANASIQDPDKVGTALKTISMTLRGVTEDGEDASELIPQLENAFNALGKGLSIMDEADPTQFKSTYEILEDLAGVWGELNDMERANMVELIGGKHQGVVVSAILNNWTDATGAYESALDSAGSAQREFNQYTDSFEYKIGQLKVAIETFWTTLVNDDAVKGFIVNLTSMIELLTQLTDVVGGVAVTGGFMALVGMLTSKNVRKFAFGAGLTEIASNLTVASRTAEGVGGKFKAVGSTVLSVGAKFLKFAGIIGAVVGVVQLLYYVATKASKDRKERIKTLEDEITAYENLKAEYEENDVGTYINLDERKNSDTGLNTDELVEYKSLQTDIINSMPELISHYDTHGEAVLKDAEAIRDLIAEKEKLNTSNIKEKLSLDIEEADFKDLNKKIRQSQDALKNQSDFAEVRDAFQQGQDYIRKEIDGLDGTTEELENKLAEFRDNMFQSLSDDNFTAPLIGSTITNIEESIRNGDMEGALAIVQDQLDIYSKQADESSKQVAQAKEDIKNNVSEFQGMVNDAVQVFTNENNIDVESNDFLFVEQIKEGIIDNLSTLSDGDVQEVIKEVPNILKNAMDSVGNTDLLFKPDIDINGINNAFDSIIGNIDANDAQGQLLIITLEAMRQKQLETANSMSANPIKPFSVQEDIMPKLQSLVTGLSGLDSAYRTLADGEELSISNVMDLITEYPELTKQLEVHNGTLRISQNAIKELAKTKEQEFKQDLEIKRQEAENAIKKAKDVIKAIKSEIEAEKLLSIAKSKGIQAATNEYNERTILARKLGEDAVVAERETNKSSRMNAISTVIDVTKELEALDSLSNISLSNNLGNIGSISSSEDKKDSSKKELQDAIYVADKYTQTLNKLNYEIQKQQDLRERTSSNSSTYIKSLKEEAKLTEQKKKAIDAEVKSLEKQISKRKIAQKGLISLSDSDDNKTARAKSAELQQEIDEAKQRLLELKGESSSVYNEIKDLTMQIIEANQSVYEVRRDSYSEDISSAEYQMSLYDEQSASYEKYAKKKISYLKQIQKHTQDELKYLQKERDTNKNLTSEQKEELYKKIRDTKVALDDAKEAVRDAETQMGEIKIEMKVEGFEKSLDDISDSVDSYRQKMNYDIGSNDYKQQQVALKEIQKLNNNQVSTIKSQINQLKSLKNTYKGNHELVSQIDEEIESWNDKLNEANISVKDIKKEIQEIQMSIIESNQSVYSDGRNNLSDDIAEVEYMMGLYDDNSKSYEKYANTRISYLAKLKASHEDELAYLEKERKTNKNLNKEQIAELDKMIVEAKKNLTSAKQAVRDAETQMGEIKINIVAEDFDNTLTEYDKKIQSLRDSITYDILGSDFAEQQSVLEDVLKNSQLQSAEIENQIQKLKELRTVYKDNSTLVSQIDEDLKEWEDKLDASQTSIKDVRKELEEMQLTLITGNADKYENQRLSLSDEVAYLEYSMSLYDENSRKYTEFAETKIEYLKKLQAYHQQELDYLEKEKATNTNLNEDQLEELERMIEERKQALYTANSDILDAEQSLNEIKINFKIEGFEEELDKYTDAIDGFRDTLSYDVDEDDYSGQVEVLQKILSLNKGQSNDIVSQIDSLKEMKELYSGNHELVSMIEEEIAEWEDKLKDVNKETKDIQKEIEEMYTSLSDDIVELYQEQMELMKQAEDDRYDEMMENEEKAHSKKVKNMNKELEKMKEIYNQQLENIDRDEATRDYEQSVEDKNKEIADLRKQLDILQYDDSYEAKAKREELEEELASKQKELNEDIHDREIELRKQNLQDQMENTEKEMQDKIDKYEEDYEKFVENEEKKKAERDKYWEQEMANERKFAELREEVLNGNFENMLETIQGWSGSVTEEMSSLGEIVTNNFTDKILEAVTALREFNQLNLSSLKNVNVDTTATNLDSDTKTINENKDEGSLSSSNGASTNARYYTTSKGDTLWDLADEYYGTGTKWTTIRDANNLSDVANIKEGTKLLIPFDTGGYTGDWNGNEGRVALLHKKELVLTDAQTENTLATVKLASRIQAVLPKTLQMIENITKVNENVSPASNTVNEGDIHINIENLNGDRNSVDLVTDQIINKIKKTKGGRF